jgi:hypothetical protein
MIFLQRYLSFRATNQVHSIRLCLKPSWQIIAVPHPLGVVHADHGRLKSNEAFRNPNLIQLSSQLIRDSNTAKPSPGAPATSIGQLKPLKLIKILQSVNYQ